MEIVVGTFQYRRYIDSECVGGGGMKIGFDLDANIVEMSDSQTFRELVIKMHEFFEKNPAPENLPQF